MGGVFHSAFCPDATLSTQSHGTSRTGEIPGKTRPPLARGSQQVRIGKRSAKSKSSQGSSDGPPIPRFQPGRSAGLGLAIVKRILELHGGAISVVSNPAAGTTFSFDLPATR
ncbi:MAG: ATP-binding protein [Chromatiales bacterium]